MLACAQFLSAEFPSKALSCCCWCCWQLGSHSYCSLWLMASIWLLKIATHTHTSTRLVALLGESPRILERVCCFPYSKCHRQHQVEKGNAIFACQHEIYQLFFAFRQQKSHRLASQRPVKPPPPPNPPHSSKKMLSVLCDMYIKSNIKAYTCDG